MIPELIPPVATLGDAFARARRHYRVAKTLAEAVAWLPVALFYGAVAAVPIWLLVTSVAMEDTRNANRTP